MAPFFWMRLNCLKVTVPMRGDSLVLPTQFPGVSDTHLINFGGTKG